MANIYFGLHAQLPECHAFERVLLRQFGKAIGNLLQVHLISVLTPASPVWPLAATFFCISMSLLQSLLRLLSPASAHLKHALCRQGYDLSIETKTMVVKAGIRVIFGDFGVESRRRALLPCRSWFGQIFCVTIKVIGCQ